MKKLHPLVESLLSERYNKKLLNEKEDLTIGSVDASDRPVKESKKVSASLSIQNLGTLADRSSNANLDLGGFY